ncbi:MAG: cytochrome c [Kordia sp.]|nr:cytochrome c [Kordia sp.]MCH2193223.1 cytochrome c [Kordia sp.]
MVPNAAGKKTSSASNTTVKTEASSEEIKEVPVVKPTFVKLANASKKDVEESLKRGKAIYTNVCVQCHLANGEGVPKAFPPLKGSDWLTDKVVESIRSVKYGLKGQITVNGVKYQGIMSPLGLSDKQVADVMNYTSTSWGNTTENFYTPEEVAKVEKE